MSYIADRNRYNQLSYERCGHSGVLLPPISLGLWHNFGLADDYENARRLIHTAFDSGITHFDLANNYGPPPGSAETCFGRILMQDLVSHRDELFIATKASHLMWDGPYGDWGSRKHMIASINQSLSRMKLEYVDVFYAHRYDPNTPIEETVGALITAVQSGKALYAGISKFPEHAAKKAYDLLTEAKVPCLVHQLRYNMLDRGAETVAFPLLRERQIGCVAFSPLAQGILTNKYLQDIPTDSRAAGSSVFLNPDRVVEQRDRIVQLVSLAESRGQSLAQMAISWVLRRPEVTSALIGASKPEQITDCLAAAQNIEFSEEELSLIDTICR